MEETERKFDWGSLIMGVLFIIVAILAFNDPGASALAVVFIVGIAVILKGIFELTFRRRIKEYTSRSHTMLIVLGIIDIIIGIIMLLNIQIGMIAIAIMFAIWIILDSVFMLITSSYIKEYSTGRFWFSVITGIIGLLLGIILLFNPIEGIFTIAFIVGIYFMIAGIVYILEAFRA